MLDLSNYTQILKHPKLEMVAMDDLLRLPNLAFMQFSEIVSEVVSPIHSSTPEVTAMCSVSDRVRTDNDDFNGDRVGGS